MERMAQKHQLYARWGSHSTSSVSKQFCGAPLLGTGVAPVEQLYLCTYALEGVHAPTRMEQKELPFLFGNIAMLDLFLFLVKLLYIYIYISTPTIITITLRSRQCRILVFFIVFFSSISISIKHSYTDTYIIKQGEAAFGSCFSLLFIISHCESLQKKKKKYSNYVSRFFFLLWQLDIYFCHCYYLYLKKK